MLGNITPGWATTRSREWSPRAAPGSRLFLSLQISGDGSRTANLVQADCRIVTVESVIKTSLHPAPR